MLCVLICTVHLNTFWVLICKVQLYSAFESRCCLLNLRYRACFEQGVPWHSGKTTKCGFILKLVCNMVITYTQMHRTDKYSQHSSIFWPVWLNGRVFVYELSGCGSESRCYLEWRFFVEIRNFLGSLKMAFWEILWNSQENICVGIYFFDKVKLCRSAASLKTRF